MTSAKLKSLNEMLEMITFHIDTRKELDAFSLRRVVASAEKIPDYHVRQMILGLAYGAARQNDVALKLFKEAAESRDDLILRNYLSYLSHTGQHRLYGQESIRLARLTLSRPLLIRARNASYANGDVELSLFFARKALTMVGDEAQKAKMQREVDMKNAALNEFITASQLSTEEITRLNEEIVEVANRHEILAVAHEFLTGTDGEAAVVCDVICKDEDILSDMDIEIATHLAMSDIFSNKNITAWFRGRERDEVEMIE